MKEVKVTPEVVKEHGLTPEEFAEICRKLGREPNYTELGLFSAMWSEHCSYKNSKSVLNLFPVSGRQVIQGPGENAGVIDIGDGLAVVMKIESHNHPSAIEPFEASATGAGGVARDIFTMGARPIGFLYSLRFGSPENKHVRYLLKEVGKGFFHYANTAAIAVLGGEIYFDSSYEKNPLVNAMCVGIIKIKDLVKATTSNLDSAVYTIGGAAGRDGIGGAAFASEGIDESQKIDSSAVAIGDPELGAILREACLELIAGGLVEGMQDMGAAGLICSSSEMAYKGGRGMEINVDLVPRKSPQMTPYEVMLSESQERMLLVLAREKEPLALNVLKKWNVPAVKIGRVTEDGVIRIKDKDTVVAEVPAKLLVEAPVYNREIKTPVYLSETLSFNPDEVKGLKNYNEALLKLISGVNLASKKIIHDKIKSELKKDILIGPGTEVTAVRLPDSHRAIAFSVNGNSTYCYLNPYRGGAIAVAEAARNLVCCGVNPLGITDGLNFGNPFKPENFWQLRKCVEGISEACRELNTPVVSGNVSLNNENPRGSIDPTPLVGMVGVIGDYQKLTSPWFKNSGDLIALVGETKEELGGSEYLKIIHGIKKGDCPEIDWGMEKKVQDFCLAVIDKGLINSAHDCSEGGLAVALAECCLSNPQKPLGASITISEVIYDWTKRIPQMEFKIVKPVRSDALLFGESQSRIIISFTPSSLISLQNLAQQYKVPFRVMGKVEGDILQISTDKEKLVKLPLITLRKRWEETFEKLLKEQSKTERKKTIKKPGTTKTKRTTKKSIPPKPHRKVKTVPSRSKRKKTGKILAAKKKSKAVVKKSRKKISAKGKNKTGSKRKVKKTGKKK